MPKRVMTKTRKVSPLCQMLFFPQLVFCITFYIINLEAWFWYHLKAQNVALK